MNSISVSIFGKLLENVSFDDVANYFSEDHGESNAIEYKAFSAEFGNFEKNISGVIRAICGLLNSDGGMVIWGAPIGVTNSRTGEKKFVGNLSPVTQYKEKDWLINKISDSISPLPVGIKVSSLQRDPNENIYLFEIQSSAYKPHQSANTYWVRLDGQTKPAPHYFIEALFRKVSFPNIEGYIKFNAAGVHNLTHHYLIITILLFNFSKLQNEENVICRLTIFPGTFLENNSYETSITEPLLHFGTPIRIDRQILLPNHSLEAKNNRMKLILSVGGKTSPIKVSDYTLDFGKINQASANNASNLIETLNENVLMSERQEALGTTRESSLRVVLGRDL